MSDSTTEPQTRDDVLASIRTARAELIASFSGLSEAQLTGPRNEGGWSIKDHLAHIAEWQRRGLAVISGKPGWEGLGIDKATFDQLAGTDEINEVLFQRHRDAPLPEVLDDFHRTHEQVERTMESLTDADLHRELQPGLTPRYTHVIGIANKFHEHDRVHIPDIEALANRS
jgi:uncharacterized damage-inducible protein DinB